MEEVNQENDKKSKKVEIKAEDQTIDDKDDKDPGKETFDIKLKTEDGVQQTETVTVNEQIEKNDEAIGFLEGAECGAEYPDNRQIMQVLRNIQQQMNVLMTERNPQRYAVPPWQPALGPPRPGPLAIDWPLLPPFGVQLQRIAASGDEPLEVAQGSGSNQLAIMSPSAGPLAIGPPPGENHPSSSSASGGVSIQPSQTPPISGNCLANPPASSCDGIQAPHARAYISGNRPALGSNVDPSDDEQPPEIQRPSEVSLSVSSVRSAAPRRSNLDRCNPF